MKTDFKLLQPYANKISFGVTLEPLKMPDAVTADQVHKDDILELDQFPGELPQCDAFITSSKNLPIMVKVADCQGVLVYDPEHEAIASVHSGWKGSALNIIGKTIQKMKAKYGSEPSKLIVAISPSIGPCCAEFSDPKNELPAFCHRFIKDNNHVDFWALSREQLKLEGVLEKNIELAGKCTRCQPGYFSHRNGDSKRMGVFVTLK